MVTYHKWKYLASLVAPDGKVLEVCEETFQARTLREALRIAYGRAAVALEPNCCHMCGEMIRMEYLTTVFE